MSNSETLSQCAYIITPTKFLMLNYEAYEKVTAGNDDMETLVETCGSNPYGDDSFLIGSCNGLVCLDTNINSWKCDIHICNPCTGFNCQVSDPIKNFEGNLTFGYGYVSSLDDYKVVILGLDWGNLIHSYIYSLCSKKWKMAGPFDQHEYPSVSGNSWSALFAETLHWGGWDSWNTETQNVAGFNLVDETFKEVKLPDLNLLGESYDMRLCVMGGGCLCFWHRVAGKVGEVWMLREYGDWTSWTKWFQMDLLPLELEWFEEPLGFTKSGKLLVRTDEQTIVLADLNQTPTKYTPLLPNLCVLDAVSYVKTLISPCCWK